jgi:peptidyl-prolyl cis-trans isomerase D
MLHKIRIFSKTIFAKILLIIIIIPFVFWGMGGVFNSGNTNNIAKINNINISTQDFINYLNNSELNPKIIRENIDNDILEQILSELVSQKLLEEEIKKLNIYFSEKSLVEKIKKNKNFFDDNKKFSRIKYEKFLLTQNLTATEFELRLKKSELRKQLFAYVSGGIKSPFFLVDNTFKEQASILNIDYFNLKNNYRLMKNFTDNEIQLFVKENSKSLEEEYIDLSYIKITPENLTGNDEYNQNFFDKIDEIENKVLNNEKLENIASNFGLTIVSKKNYIFNNLKNNLENEIYKMRSIEKYQLIDKNEFYILYNIEKINKILPSLEDKDFKEKIRNLVFEKEKYDYNKKLLKEINDQKMNNFSFNKLAKGEIKNIKLNSFKDDKKFTKNSIELLYSLPLKSYTLISDEEENVYLAHIKGLNVKNINKESKDFINFNNQTNIRMRDNIYSSYDYFLNDRYKVTVNKKTLDRVKNYFR